ncbi:MAG: serine/threonine protein kinase [Anaerolineae bacterium]|nr:serine/threonine protein kinase [Anaerolineae bacterium]
MNYDPLLGRQLDEYRLDELLGRGGMASVYRATDLRLGRATAIKVIAAPFQADDAYITRFEREARAIAGLVHPHLITLYRFGEAGGLLYMAMRYVEGYDLGAVIRSYHEDGAFIEWGEVARLASEIGGALDYAHAHGVIHRDIKPGNIMIAPDGSAIVVDFGLALLQAVGTYGEIFGSPHYVAPEQAVSSADAVPASDQYALGVVLYEMLTGQQPFDGPGPLEISLKHMHEPPPLPRALRPELPPAAEEVLLRALAKQPSDRFPSCTTLAAALTSGLRGEGVPAK